MFHVSVVPSQGPRAKSVAGHERSLYAITLRTITLKVIAFEVIAFEVIAFEVIAFEVIAFEAIAAGITGRPADSPHRVPS
jgi:hypothetical protein